MKNLDDLLRERLYDAEVPPPAFVWPNVERELRQRRRRIFFWWFLGAGLLGATGLWQFTARTVQPAGGLTQQAPATPAQSAVDPSVLATHHHAPQGSEALPNLSQQTTDQPEPAVLAPDQSGRSSTQKTHFLDKKSTAKTSTLSEAGVARAADESEGQQVETTFVRASGGAAMQSPSDAHALANATELAAGPAADEYVEPKNRVLNTAAQPLAERGLPDKLPLSDYRLLVEQPLSDQLFPHAKTSVRKKINKYKNCYDFNSHPNVFLLDLYTGPSLVRKDLRPVSPEESWYRQRRLATERSDWAFHAGVRGTLLLNQHFLIRTGLHYDQITEVFEYADPNYKEVNIRQRSILVNGVWKTVSDTTVTYGEHYTKTYNRLGMLDIPIQLGVEVRNRRSGVSLQAGASVNVLFWKRGDILSMDDQPASFAPSDDELEVFRPRTGLSISGSVQWFYHLKPRLRVFAEPYFRQVLRPVTLSTHPVEQRYGIGGIRLGLTKILD